VETEISGKEILARNLPGYTHIAKCWEAVQQKLNFSMDAFELEAQK
jgi:hypothetical protein